MGRRRRVVWVVMHYEIMGTPDAPRVDSVQFHVASSLQMAEDYIGRVWVDHHSWWQVHPHEVDAPADGDEGEETYYYSHRRTPLKAAPIRRAIAAFRKHAARHPEHYPARPKDEGPGTGETR
ncbi:hypothetical protein [Paludisphaera soli]|uniref:hypothetical protein n=1 Tax=Paludisphaera soli TaxID=2712865 RepID=UPI0013EAE17E|nr:hypothetical protein [Paludisphaera soli]